MDLDLPARRAGTRCSSTAPSSTSRRTRARRSRWSPRPSGYGAQVEGEIESVVGVEDGIGSEEGGEVHPVEVSGEFIAATGVYSFAPGDRHRARPLQGRAEAHARAGDRDRRAVHPIPQVLHGGTGLTEAQFTDLIARGCAKVNISTALKIAFVDAHREYLDAEPRQARPALAVRARARGGQGDGRVPHPHLRVGGPGIGDDLRGRLTRAGADLRLRRRARRHRARRAPPGVQPDLRRGRAAGPVVRGGVRRQAADRRRQGADGVAADRRVRRARNGLPADAEGQKELLAGWHRRKTAIYKEMVARRAGCPARPGIARIVDEALAAGWALAVASTSAEESVRAVLEHVVGRRDARRASRSSPATSCRPRSPTRRSTCSRSSGWASTRDDAIVVEDSRNGLLAAVGAGPALRRHGQRLHGRRGHERGGARRHQPRRPRRAGARARQPQRRAARRPGDARRPRGLPRENPCPTRRLYERHGAEPGGAGRQGRSPRRRSTTRRTSASSTRSSATGTSATRWRAASRSC